MGYSKNVRQKLLHTECKKPCCASSEISGMLSASDEVINSKDVDIVGRLAYLSKKRGDYNDKSGTFDDCCKKAFIKGAFEIKGSLSAPEYKSPYIEINFNNEDDAIKIRELLNTFSISAGISGRRGKYVLYVKNAQGVADFLLLVDAPGEALKFIVSKTDREVQNNTNRIMNCDMANIERLTLKYERELKLIKKLNENGNVSKLPEGHRKIAEARLLYPLATYEEIGKLIVPSCSKSTVSVKMRDILKECEKL